MRIYDTLSRGSYKVTIFVTENRYIFQVEDESHAIKWKLSKELLSSGDLIREATENIVKRAEEIWPLLKEKNVLPDQNTSDPEDDFPNII